MLPVNLENFARTNNTTINRQTLTIVAASLLCVVILAVMFLHSPPADSLLHHDEVNSDERRQDIERHVRQEQKLAAQETQIKSLQRQIDELKQNQRRDDKAPQRHRHNNGTNTTVPRSSRPPHLSPSPSSSPSSSPCRKQKHAGTYEPKFFYPGQEFPPGQTPLTFYQANPRARPPVPSDWQGGYGWVFEKYIPSEWELRWKFASYGVEKNMDGTPLIDLRDGIFKEQKNLYMADLHRFPSNSGKGKSCSRGDKPPAEPLVFNDKIYSKFEYVYKCTAPPCPEIVMSKNSSSQQPNVGDKKFSYIEPLVGILRHPNASNALWHTVLDKNYMVVDPWPLVHGSRSTATPSRQRVLYFDAGASVWNQGSGGASQSWFYDVYRAECLNFSGWFMFESDDKLNQTTVFSQLPGHIKPAYRWFNIPLSTDPASWDNPVNHLLSEARREDIVIFKIDFDSPYIELGLIHHILELPQVWELIDELYFEHHVNTEVLRWAWKTSNLGIWHSDSLKLFTQLRERGIRAHSWV